jgi:hypothetical protein
MNALASRKRLLIAESELNRAQLMEDCQRMAADASALTRRATSLNAFATAVLSLVTVCVSNISPAAPPEKTAWWQTVIKSVQPIAALWAVFRNRPK